MASKTSAVADNEPIDVLFALHEKFDIMDLAGPLEILSSAQHDPNNPGTSLFMRRLLLVLIYPVSFVTQEFADLRVPI